MKPFQLRVPIYEDIVLVAVGKPVDVGAWLAKRFKVEEEDLTAVRDAEGAVLGLVSKKKGSEWTIIYINATELKRKKKEPMVLATVAHEVYHTTSKLLEQAEVPYDDENHEAHAYLNGWLCSKIYPKVRERWKELRA